MSVLLEFKHLLANRERLCEGETSYWLGNTAYQVEMPSSNTIKRLWQKHVPGTKIRFIAKGTHYRMLAVPIGTSKKKRDAFLVDLLTRCKMAPTPWPFPEPAAN
jgi:hypothetical protein